MNPPGPSALHTTHTHVGHAHGSPPPIPEDRPQTAPTGVRMHDPPSPEEDRLSHVDAAHPESSPGEGSSGSVKDAKGVHGTPRTAGIWNRLKGRRESEDGSGKLRTWLKGRERMKARGVTPRDEPEDVAKVPPAGMLGTPAGDEKLPRRMSLSSGPCARRSDKAEKLHASPDAAPWEGPGAGRRPATAETGVMWSDTVPEIDEV